jgi:hypothetical protein
MNNEIVIIEMNSTYSEGEEKNIDIIYIEGLVIIIWF